jgi:predicted RNA binding protein YcfA (HicA-like mRNA interferase family)
MADHKQVLSQVLSGRADANIRFDELCHLLERLGFSMQVRGSHHVFRRPGTAEKLNLQPQSGKAKPYQVRQIRKVLVHYGIDDTKI